MLAVPHDGVTQLGAVAREGFRGVKCVRKSHHFPCRVIGLGGRTFHLLAERETPLGIEIITLSLNTADYTMQNAQYKEYLFHNYQLSITSLCFADTIQPLPSSAYRE